MNKEAYSEWISKFAIQLTNIYHNHIDYVDCQLNEVNNQFITSFQFGWNNLTPISFKSQQHPSIHGAIAEAVIFCSLLAKELGLLPEQFSDLFNSNVIDSLIKENKIQSTYN